MKKQIAMLAAASLALASPVTNAQNAAGKAWAHIQNYAPPQEQRLKTAAFLAHECEYLDGLVPRLSPQEEAWLRSEVNAGRVGDRIVPEYARVKLLQIFGQCATAAKSIASANNAQAESVAWLALLSALVDPFDTRRDYVSGANVPSLAREAERAQRLRLFVQPMLDNVVFAFAMRDL